MEKDFRISTIFNSYRNIVFMVQNDLSFAESMLDAAFTKFDKSSYDKLQSSIYAVYDIEHDTEHGMLKSFGEGNHISVEDLPIYKQRFLSWTLNLSILKIYNAMEIFMLQAIWAKSFPHLQDPIKDKSANDILIRKIKDTLVENGVSVDTRNNRYLISFFTAVSPTCASLMTQPMRVDLKTNWSAFFELISTLRNVIAHQGTIVTNNLKNEINSKAGDIFKRHFELQKDLNDNLNLQPNISQFSNFIALVNDFTLNTIKFFFNEPNLDFLGMK